LLSVSVFIEKQAHTSLAMIGLDKDTKMGEKKSADELLSGSASRMPIFSFPQLILNENARLAMSKA
jgi:hypothetical protein